MDRSGPWERELARVEEQHGVLGEEMAVFLDSVRQGRPAGELDR